MSRIEVKVFNTPTVHINEEQVHFPFRKAEALFYYLLIEGEATRDELVNLLWGEIDEETAKKNLRNAMYKIRKVFDLDIIISPQKSIVMLNPQIKLKTDLDAFLSEDQQSIDVYTGEFLQGFLVKDGEHFEEWMFSIREQYRDLYINKINQRIEEEIQQNTWDSIEYYGKLLISEDQFDERAYRTLMKLYIKEGAYNKAIDIHQKLAKTLDMELGIKPDAETRKIYEEALALRDLLENKPKANRGGFFYGRNEEIAQLAENTQLFTKEIGAKSQLIIGEAGIGKTRLKEQFLQMIEHQDVYVFHTNCYQAEEKYILKPWNPIFSKIADIIKKDKISIPSSWKKAIAYFFPIFAMVGYVEDLDYINDRDPQQYQMAEEAIQGLFKSLGEEKKIVLIMEDLQWIDTKSLSLLNSLLLHQQQSHIMFVGTCRNGYDEKIDKFIAVMTKYNLLEKIQIKRFNQVEVGEFIQGALPNTEVKEELKKKIYHETEGNTFFLVEYINALKENRGIGEMSSEMQDILKSRLIDLSEIEMKALNIVSLFFDKVSLDLLAELLGKEELDVLEIMEELQRRWLIKEKHEEDKISFLFTHQKLREFVYLQQSPAKRKLLHNRIGLMMENQLKNEKSDMLMYTRLIYHYSHGGNRLATLKYQIKYVNGYLDFTHELYPVLSNNTKIKEKSLHLSKQEVKKYLVEVESMLREAEEQEPEAEGLIDLQMAFNYMKGRYLIGEGEYEEGIPYLQKLINYSLEGDNYYYGLKGFKQMIYYGIQTHNVPLMEEYLDKGLALVHENKIKKEEPFFLRLKGLSKIMLTEYDEAEEFLKQSIGLFKDFSKMEDKYVLNIAASYNYLGEVRRYKMQFASALVYYDKAMEICEEKKVTRGLTIFNTNGGQAAFDMGDYDRAKMYFSKALKIYRQFDISWGRAIAEGYMALLQIRKGNYRGALEGLKRAEAYSDQLKSPYEMGLIYRVKAEIKTNMKTNEKLREVFKNYLREDLEDYCNKGITVLKQVKGCYEIQILEVLKKS
ncbi:AAA family ATPase [Alkaliphilus hydrothermalis]|uniref:DNA-binding SARP family transcriptional activator/predicted ATPase n=1 Tax=Alkaliphilus hydrothermalis TaxID=1482730 RepID=A0ABS2NML3_9FIRM|nr:AAA family ATPase [Alkaliphilus hydrothermalis]MBM7614198.1 DNA-binding SARP family transcriptional activator/predicted ATPase [Alkaliphilus hydrothermalis]